MEIVRGEMVEKELNAMIERRSCLKDPDEESELWRESVRAYEEKRRQMARLEWHLHHTAQAERLRRAHATAEATLVEARRRVRLNERQGD